MITMAVAAEDEGTLSLDDCSVLHEKDSGENERQGGVEIAALDGYQIRAKMRNEPT